MSRSGSSDSKNKNCATRSYVVGFTQEQKHEDSMLLMLDFLRTQGVRASFVQRVSRVRKDQREVPMVDIQVREQASIVLLLEGILPHLVIKKKLASEALGYVEDRLFKRGHGVQVVAAQPKDKIWTAEELDKVVALRRAGHSTRSIAGALGRSMDSVAHKLSRLGQMRVLAES